MARIASGMTAAALIALLTSGCVQLRRPPQTVAAMARSAEEAPTVELLMDRESAEPEPTIALVSSRREPEVTFIDARPDFEKQYYPGETDPHRWRDAVTVLPLESFQPAFDELLKRSLLNSLRDASQCESLVCEIRSFHVAMDERNRSEEDLLYDYKQWDDGRERREEDELQRAQMTERLDEEARRSRRAAGFPNINGSDDDPTFADKVAKGLFKAVVVKPLQIRKLRKAKTEQLREHPQTLPARLTKNKQQGWNCCLSVSVTSRTTDGETKTVPLEVLTHRPKDDSEPVKSQMQRVVLSAIEELGRQSAQAELSW